MAGMMGAMAVGMIIQPGTQSTASLQLPKPSLYQAYCSIPGHREAGMTLDFMAV
ncbi:hypothetical protein D3C81_2289830 [compost metagenome]